VCDNRRVRPRVGHLAHVVGAVTSSGLLAVVLAACGGGNGKVSATVPGAAAVAKPATGAVPWPAPANALHFAQLAGVPLGRYEYGVPGHPGKHIHTHLDVFVNGTPARVPAGIGIQINVPGVQHGTSPDGTPSYGGIRICARPCIAALHTHDDSGVLHVESQQPRTYRVGQVFTEWNVRLDQSCVGGYCKPQDSILVYVDGKRYPGNPAGIELTDLEEIAIVIGSPPSRIPSSYF
jgi:hypothetical protein